MILRRFGWILQLVVAVGILIPTLAFADGDPNFPKVCRDELGYRVDNLAYAICLAQMQALWQEDPQGFSNRRKVTATIDMRSEDGDDCGRFCPDDGAQPASFLEYCHEVFGFVESSWGIANCASRQRSLWHSNRELFYVEQARYRRFNRRRHQIATQGSQRVAADPAPKTRPDFICYCYDQGIADDSLGMAVCREKEQMLWTVNPDQWWRGKDAVARKQCQQD